MANKLMGRREAANARALGDRQRQLAELRMKGGNVDRMKLEWQSVFYNRSASGGQQTLNLFNDFALEGKIIAVMQLIIRGTMTSGGGGAITGFHRDAPAGMIVNAKLEGNYRGGLSKNKRVIFDMPPQQMFYPGNFNNAIFHALLRTSTGAAATDPFRATIPVPLVDKNADTQGQTYIDCRDYTSLKLDLRWAADADIATTNVSTVQAVELEIKLGVIVDGPARGTPHYEPSITYKELNAETSSPRLTQDGDLAWDGELWALWLQQFDDSGAGDAERVDGLLRALYIDTPKGQAVPFMRWDPLRRSTWEQYPPVLTTTEVVGVAAILFQPPRKSERGQLQLVRNTSDAVPPGVTAITPAAGDRIMCTLISAEPVYGAYRLRS